MPVRSPDGTISIVLPAIGGNIIPKSVELVWNVDVVEIEEFADRRMLPMTKFVSRFMQDESGATAIEYGLIAALIAVVIISAVTALGETIKVKFNEVVTGMGGTAGA